MINQTINLYIPSSFREFVQLFDSFLLINFLAILKIFSFVLADVSIKIKLASSAYCFGSSYETARLFSKSSLLPT
jgi:hypothetical protein